MCQFDLPPHANHMKKVEAVQKKVKLAVSREERIIVEFLEGPRVELINSS
jgi:hypothetical protein